MFAPGSHAFMAFGVETNRQLQPAIEGDTVHNLYCCGSLLAHYNPVAEGSGGGVAISSGFYAAEQVVAAAKQDKAAEEVVAC
jgi:glycerol-3-phosphate dehydrogenase subunit B